jgi:hypothetical protein
VRRRPDSDGVDCADDDTRSIDDTRAIDDVGRSDVDPRDHHRVHDASDPSNLSDIEVRRAR